MKRRKEFAELDRAMFLRTYANTPACMRDKPCGLSWNDVYKLLEEGMFK